MKMRTPPNFSSLILQGIQILRALGSTSSEDASYIELTASIVEIRNFHDKQPWVAAEELKALGHNESNRSNAAIGFALASLPSSWMTSENQAYWHFMQWNPLSKTAPSTMEILAQEAFAGAASFSQIPGILWSVLQLETRVLIGLCEATRKSPEKGYEILIYAIEELKSSYGPESMEFLLVGTTLVNCCNKAQGSKAGEETEIGLALLQSLHESMRLPPCVEFPQQAYFLIAMADTYLAQGNYAEAEPLLLQVVGYPLTDNETAMSAKLRLLKMSRRQRRSSLNLDDWRRLWDLAAGFRRAPDAFKYEILEESISFLSVLDPKDILGSPLEPWIFKIVKSLSAFPINEYGGSSASRKNLAGNIDALQRYKNEFNLFSVSGPQLYFCRMVRDRFRQATVQVAERVGAANWQRFQRIKAMWEESEPGEEIIAQHEVPDTGKSKFHDSGIGSSVGSESKLPGQLDTNHSAAQYDIPETGNSKVYDSSAGLESKSIGQFNSDAQNLPHNLPDTRNSKLPDLRDLESKHTGQFDSRVPQKARSVISFRSFMQNEFGATELPPMPLENEEGNRVCLICRKLLKGINSESQWRFVVLYTRY
jgi:hypothetical protein